MFFRIKILLSYHSEGEFVLHSDCCRYTHVLTRFRHLVFKDSVRRMVEDLGTLCVVFPLTGKIQMLQIGSVAHPVQIYSFKIVPPDTSKNGQ